MAARRSQHPHGFLIATWLLCAPIAGPLQAETVSQQRYSAIDDPLKILEEEIDAAAEVLREMTERKAASHLLTQRAVEAFGIGDYAEAESILLDQRAIDPDNFVVHYNLSCARSALGKVDDANSDLRRAVELGFSNRVHLERDPYLAPLRTTDDFRMLIEHWDRVIGMQRTARLEQAKGWVRGKRVIMTDNALRLDVVSAHDEHETSSAMREINQVARWAESLMPVDESGFATPPPFVVVALPDERDFLKWAFWTYGERARRAFAGIGGAYEHDQKRLVAQDLGGTLRHEFFHALHWRDMDRLGQLHPIWIQEGLASLVEDMDPPRRSRPPVPAGSTPKTDGPLPPPIESGAWIPVPSWRTNIVKRLARSGGLPGFAEFASMDHHTFSTKRPLATYAHARTILLYLRERGALDAWYTRYTSDPAVGFAADPTGLTAMEAVLDEELPGIERGYRQWVRDELPMVPEDINTIDVSLTFDLEHGEGDGPFISRIGHAERRATGLRRLDVITAIDGRPVRDLKELVRVLASYNPGDTVRVEYRRVKLHGSGEVTLAERGS